MFHNGEVSGLVKALELELQYYKNMSKEQEAVIKQLHRGYVLPGEVTYIHPYNFAEILQNIDFIDVYPHPEKDNFNNLIWVKGTAYKQSPYMPQITNNIR
jgi:hypothetical protein